MPSGSFVQHSMTALACPIRLDLATESNGSSDARDFSAKLSVPVAAQLCDIHYDTQLKNHLGYPAHATAFN